MILHNNNWATVTVGDCLQSLRTMADQSVQMCVTSPPYFGLRDYGHDGQIGLEATPDAYVAKLVEVFREVRRVLRDDGTLWLNLGDSYAGSWGAQSRGGPPSDKSTLKGNGHIGGGPKVNALSKIQVEAAPKTRRTGAIPAGSGLKPKDLIGIPWLVAFALRADGWYLRQGIIWHKPNPMPESVTDRFTKSYEDMFLLTKSPRYYFDNEAVKENSVTSIQDQIAKRNKHPHKGQRDAGMRETTGGFDKINRTYETRNRRNVWTIASRPYAGAHFATFPPGLVEPCILAGSRPGDVVLDPFGGSGTTVGVALAHGRNAMMLELNAEYAALMPERAKGICNAFTMGR